LPHRDCVGMLDGKLVNASEHLQAGPQISSIDVHRSIVTGCSLRHPRTARATRCHPLSVSVREPETPAPRSRWPYISLIPIGLGAWAPIYAGVKARQRSWVLLGVVWSAVVVAGLVKNSLSKAGHSGNDDLAGFLMILGWVGAVATSFTIRGPYERRMESPLLAATEAGEARLHDRRRALEIARAKPALAREIGVGRPDRPGAFDAGLIDVNNAPAIALLRLPGVDDRLATRIIEVRTQCDGFSSLEDLGIVLDLPGDLVERLRDHVIFLSR